MLPLARTLQHFLACCILGKRSDFMALSNRIKIGTAIDKKLYEQLKELSETTRIPMSKLMDESIEDLIKKYENSAK